MGLSPEQPPERSSGRLPRDSSGLPVSARLARRDTTMLMGAAEVGPEAAMCVERRGVVSFHTLGRGREG